MGNNQRLLATALIWMAFAAIAMYGINSRMDEPALVFIVAICALAAASSTRALWTYSAEAGEEAEKAKRQGRVGRLMAALSEDDLAELRARLAAGSDGEALSLDDLLRR